MKVDSAMLVGIVGHGQTDWYVNIERSCDLKIPGCQGDSCVSCTHPYSNVLVYFVTLFDTSVCVKCSYAVH